MVRVNLELTENTIIRLVVKLHVTDGDVLMVVVK
jgi:hypothetical protein